MYFLGTFNQPMETLGSSMGELDDGWPESVEEQSLLLLAWRHYITRQCITDVPVVSHKAVAEVSKIGNL